MRSSPFWASGTPAATWAISRTTSRPGCTLGTAGGASTIVATALGAWILFGPAEAATWGGIANVIGYAVGAGGVCFVFIPLGRRMREVMPRGHSLTEFLWHRFGKPIYVVVLIAMLFYMFIFLTAELTAMAGIVALIADIPLWVTASVVMAATLAYTLYGGLRASIFTDAVQLVIILPVLLGLMVVGWIAAGGASGVSAGLAERAPQLADPTFSVGVQGGLTLTLGVILANLFHQGYWQRIFAARDDATMRRSFITAGIVAGLAVFAMGLFGLAYVGMGKEGAASTAVFAVLFEALPPWLMLVVMVAGLALVMSSADTIINGISSIIVVDLGRAMPALGSEQSVADRALVDARRVRADRRRRVARLQCALSVSDCGPDLRGDRLSGVLRPLPQPV